MAKSSPTKKLGNLTQYEERQFLAIAAERERRQLESLKLYEPLPFQDAYHRATNKEVILQKANQAGGPARLSTPTLTPNGWVPLGEIKPGDEVIGGDGKPCKVTHVFRQGVLPIYKLTFDDGATTNCSLDHYWKCKLKKSERFGKGRKDKWGVYSLRQILEHGGYEPEPARRAMVPVCVAELDEQPVPVDPYTLGVLLGDGCIRNTIDFTTEDVEIAEMVSARVGSEVVVTQRRSSPESGNAERYGVAGAGSGKGSNPVLNGLRELGLHGLLSRDKFIPRCYLDNSVEVRLQLLRGLMDTDGSCDKRGTAWFYTNSGDLAKGVVDLVRSLGGKAKMKWRETSIVVKKGAPRKQCLNMAVVRISMEHLSPFALKRKTERWNTRQGARNDGRFLYKIEPIGNEECACLSVTSPDHTYVTENYIVTHNSLSGFVEVARAVTGQDPYDKYPKENGVAVCLGYGENHIGRVIHKYLFRSGGFQIIRDLDTGQWRTFRPWPKTVEHQGRPGDAGREEEAKPAPPLIPPRYIDGKIAWVKRSARIFNYVKFTTGWELYALNSAGEASQAQGFQVNLYHIDEDVATSGWHEEATGRTAIPKGLIRWTALPHAKTEDIMNMIQRAIDEEEENKSIEERTTVRITATMFDNPFYPEDSKKANERIWRSQGEDVFRKRALGEVVLDSLLMYPTFSKDIHGATSRHEKRNRLQEVLTERNGEPPANWCRYMVVDPGHTICAVAFFAVPPAEVGNFKVLYDELYMRNCDRHMFGRYVEEKTKGRCFQEFIIDAHGGNLRELGSGILPRKQYEMELEGRGIECVARGSAFTPGSDDIKGREEKLRQWLGIRENGFPLFYVVLERCPNFVREINRFKKKTVRIGGQDVPTDDGNRRANSHLVECVEYAAAHGLPFHKPVDVQKKYSIVGRIKAARKLRAQQRAVDSYNPNARGRILGPRGTPLEV